jgi:hypothetical protein
MVQHLNIFNLSRPISILKYKLYQFVKYNFIEKGDVNKFINN